MLAAVSGLNRDPYGLAIYGARGTVRSIPAAQTGTPVNPVNPVKATPEVFTAKKSAPFSRSGLMRQWETDPVATAVRGRISYPNGKNVPGAQNGSSFPGTKKTAVPGMSDEESGSALKLPGASDKKENGLPALPGTKKPPLPGTPEAEKEEDDKKVPGKKSKTAAEVAEEGECQTCKNRKYQDGSDDPGVSFKTPTHIGPDQAASAVRGHENEHVVREQAKAARENRRVVNQSVTYHTAICPECGRVYVSGGTTRTTTAAAKEPVQPEKAEKPEDDQSANPTAA